MIATYQRFIYATFQALFTLLGVAVVAYILFHILPERSIDWGSFLSYINDLSPVSIDRGKENHKLWTTIIGIEFSQFDLVLKWPFLGTSSSAHRSVGMIILDALPETLVLVLGSVLFSALLGIPLGVIAARWSGSWFDGVLNTLASAGMAIPSFVAALIVMWVFGYLLGSITHLPVTGSLFQYDFSEGGFVVSLQNLILPLIAISIRPISLTAQLMRNSMVEVLSKDYIRTARASGLSERSILFKHALINAILPVLNGLVIWTSSLFAGSIFVEIVFGWKGLGHVLLNAIDDQDFPVMMGLMLVFSTTFILLNLVLELITPIFDPSQRPG